MPINPVSSVGSAEVAQAITANTQQTAPQPQAQIKQQPVTDTVSLSSSAKAKAAAQELAETAAQTAQEANKGDLQALRLLARRQAEEALSEAKANTVQDKFK